MKGNSVKQKNQINQYVRLSLNLSKFVFYLDQFRLICQSDNLFFIFLSLTHSLPLFTFDIASDVDEKKKEKDEE